MAPLVAEVAASRQTIERQAGEISDLREERGRHTAELERAASTIVALGDENAALKASQAKQDAKPAPVVPVPAIDAPVPLLARLRAQAPWLLLTAILLLALVVGVSQGR